LFSLNGFVTETSTGGFSDEQMPILNPEVTNLLLSAAVRLVIGPFIEKCKLSRLLSSVGSSVPATAMVLDDPRYTQNFIAMMNGGCPAKFRPRIAAAVPAGGRLYSYDVFAAMPLLDQLTALPSLKRFLLGHNGIRRGGGPTRLVPKGRTKTHIGVPSFSTDPRLSPLFLQLQGMVRPTPEKTSAETARLHARLL
tara:strand:+ start:262 stop:846 length:585 start_codon:yes stop_codon:yes gene_type:complete